MNVRMSQPRAIYYVVRHGQTTADVHFNCPMCGRRAHMYVSGNRKVKMVNDFLTDSNFMQHNLVSFDNAERQFLRDGTCRECQELYFGTTSKKIKYVRKNKKGEII